MNIAQGKFPKAMVNAKGIKVTTFKEGNRIIGWDVNGRKFPVKGTLLETFKRVETYIKTL